MPLLKHLQMAQPWIAQYVESHQCKRSHWPSVASTESKTALERLQGMRTGSVPIITVMIRAGLHSVVLQAFCQKHSVQAGRSCQKSRTMSADQQLDKPWQWLHAVLSLCHGNTSAALLESVQWAPCSLHGSFWHCQCRALPMHWYAVQHMFHCYILFSQCVILSELHSTGMQCCIASNFEAVLHFQNYVYSKTMLNNALQRFNRCSQCQWHWLLGWWLSQPCI